MVFPFAFEMLALLLDCNGSFLVAIFVMAMAVTEAEEEEETQRWCLLGEFEEWGKCEEGRLGFIVVQYKLFNGNVGRFEI